jgi:hypothetical protein
VISRGEILEDEAMGVFAASWRDLAWIKAIQSFQLSETDLGRNWFGNVAHPCAWLYE